MTRQDGLITTFIIVHILCVIALAVGLGLYYMDYIETHTFDTVSANQKFYERHMFREPWNSGQ